MKYDTIIFDFDGTLADTQEGVTKGMQKGLAAVGIEESLEVIRGLIGPPLTVTIQQKYGLSPKRAAVTMKICEDHQLGDGIGQVCLFEGIPELLSGLKELGLRLAVATNCPQTTAMGQLAFLRRTDRFDAIQTNNDPQTRGTKTQFVRWAMEDCGSTPDRCLMVGDRKHDIIGGRENGMDTAAVLYGYGSREELEGCAPIALCATPADLLEFIKNS